MTTISYTPREVEQWGSDDVLALLKILDISDELIDFFHENDVTGSEFLKLDDDAIVEMNLSDSDQEKLKNGLSSIRANEGKEETTETWQSDSEDESTPSETSQASTSSSQPMQRKVKNVNKKSDPLRVAARSKAVGDLAGCTVASGYLYKVGGSTLRISKWKKRFFVLTDDNCLFYFKSPKELSALGMILLPSYTITPTDRTDSVSGKPHSFKAFNREHKDARTYYFACDNAEDMKKWMNVMSLASISFGSGKASMAKASSKPSTLTSDAEAEMVKLRRKASERAGGVDGDDDAVKQQTGHKGHGIVLPSYLKRGKSKQSSKGPLLTVVKLLDKEPLQLYTESGTTGQDLLDQVCTILQIAEKFYFGLSFYDNKGELDWVNLEKKVLKQDIPRRSDFIELHFAVQFFPIDVTQVLQYSTLYQTFLSARASIMSGDLEVSNKDAFLLASLGLQATHGDFNPEKHSIGLLSKEDLIPDSNKDDIIRSSGLAVNNISTFWAEEVLRVWQGLCGILRHLAVLKYMQIVQKHKQFAVRRFDVKNKNGTPLVLGVHPKGLFCFRLTNLYKPVVSFSWGECAELSYTDKKFSIQVHDKDVKTFSVYSVRSKTCQRILDLCVGLHRLFVQDVQHWENAPKSFSIMRRQAAEMALKEREGLKKEAKAASERAKRIRDENAALKKTNEEPPKGEAPPEPKEEPKSEVAKKESSNVEEEPTEDAPQAPSEVIEGDTGETVYIKGRSEAVAMLDLMMEDDDFMKFQEEMLAGLEDDFEEQIEQGGRLRSESFLGGKRPNLRPREDIADENVDDRVDYIDQMGM
eukprot:m.18532 g.18532  ORF g.18532 m.18532 type:complete len:811 (-) comp4975_c1_seq1:916-3348(-)